MKKKLWGYHIRQTNDLIDSLQNKNDILVKKVNELSIKLNTKNSKLTEARTSIADEKDNDLLRDEISKLHKENQSISVKYETQIKTLQKEKQLLTKKLDESIATKHKRDDNHGSVGPLFERVYKDIEILKIQTADEMLRHVDIFNGLVNKAKHELHSSMTEINLQYDDSVKHIYTMINRMYEDLKTVEQACSNIEKQLLEQGKTANQVNEPNTGVQTFAIDIHEKYNEAVKIISLFINDFYNNLKLMESSRQSIELQFKNSDNLTISLKEKIKTFVNQSIYNDDSHASCSEDKNELALLKNVVDKTSEKQNSNTFRISMDVKPSDILGE